MTRCPTAGIVGNIYGQTPNKIVNHVNSNVGLTAVFQ